MHVVLLATVCPVLESVTHGRASRSVNHDLNQLNDDGWERCLDPKPLPNKRCLESRESTLVQVPLRRHGLPNSRRASGQCRG
jgi:hypothetical protein